MRRVLFFLIAASFLGTMVGCNTCGSRGCGQDNCSVRGGATGGRTHAHGICDCDHDDHCSSRSPWVRHGHAAPVTHVVPAPVGETVPVAPKVLPDGKLKL